MYTLGIWDGHDSGAALLLDDRILYAANEERFTKRKLEVSFPENAIRAALQYAGINASDVGTVAFTTTEMTKTLERLYPYMKENYYQFRRRKERRPAFEDGRRMLKYKMTGIGVLPFCNRLSRWCISRHLDGMGFRNYKLEVVEHHAAHAATAAFTSGMKSALVVTLDGLGDGLSGSVSVLENGKLERKIAIPARSSLGILYEQVTNIVGMRELEDEGKVMAMACYSYPFQYSENRLRDFIRVRGVDLVAKHGAWAQYRALKDIAWQMPREQFAYMAQQLLESVLGSYVSNLIDEFGIGDVAFAGGIFSNVKANMAVRSMDKLRSWYVFPHMGDGGIALGSALLSRYRAAGTTRFDFTPYLGWEYTTDYTKKVALADGSFDVEEMGQEDVAGSAADLVEDDEYVLWFQGRMEYGPRALGNRSIIARSDSPDVKEKLNMRVKRREWFQPFAPSILEEDLEGVVEYDDKGYDRFMTMAYAVRPDARELTKSVEHVDGSVRTQVVGEGNEQYKALLRQVKRRLEYGIVLNTSFNLHGSPIVMSPEDALSMMKATKSKHLFINGLYVTNKEGD